MMPCHRPATAAADPALQLAAVQAGLRELLSALSTLRTQVRAACDEVDALSTHRAQLHAVHADPTTTTTKTKKKKKKK